jgi:ribosomal protein L14
MAMAIAATAEENQSICLLGTVCDTLFVRVKTISRRKNGSRFGFHENLEYRMRNMDVAKIPIRKSEFILLKKSLAAR